MKNTFARTLRAEWIKSWSVRSTWWTLFALVLVGAGLTVLLCAANASWLASDEADEPAKAFVTWGMMIAQVCAVIVGALAATAEYGSGMIRTSFAAVPRRGAVFAAKAIIVTGVLLVLGTATAFAGYLGANVFLERAGVGVPLEGDVLRSLFGSGMFLAVLGLMSVAVGFLLRHTAGAISLVLGTIFVAGPMSGLIPGKTGEWISKLMPGNAAEALAAPVPFNPDALGPWVGFAVMLAWAAALGLAAHVALRTRDA
jgi:ABC-2 type transport system permease protein